MSKENNIQDLLHDVADAIREKKGTEELINPQDFSKEIKSIKTSSSIWTGHADVEGLKAIGWDDDDIAYYQEHGVNWMEEDDEYHKVSDDNKALYGVINADNYKEYKDRIVYLPKIDLQLKGYETFNGFRKMVGLPILDISDTLAMYNTFLDCHCLPYVIPIKTTSIYRLEGTFRNCYALSYIPNLSIDSSVGFIRTYEYCMSLESVHLDFNAPASSIINPFSNTACLSNVKVRGINVSLQFNSCRLISKPSLLYMINNEAATSAIIITLHALAYTSLSTDPDIVEALSNHPLVTLASA